MSKSQEDRLKDAATVLSKYLISQPPEVVNMLTMEMLTAADRKVSL